MNNSNYHNCIKCKDDFVFDPGEVEWIERGTYSEKIVRCPFCNCINVIKYDDAFGLYVNEDERYFK